MLHVKMYRNKTASFMSSSVKEAFVEPSTTPGKTIFSAAPYSC